MKRKGRLTAQKTGDYVSDTVEKEEFGDVEGFDQHSEAGCNYGGQSDYVDDADNLEDDVTWACQGFLEERHCYDEGYRHEIRRLSSRASGTEIVDKK